MFEPSKSFETKKPHSSHSTKKKHSDKRNGNSPNSPGMSLDYFSQPFGQRDVIGLSVDRGEH